MSAIIAIAIIATLQRGFLGPWLKTKGSRGRLTLVRVISITGDYFKTGTIDEGMLFFKDRMKEQRMITITKRSVYDAFGVKNIEVDDEKNTVFDRDAWAVVNGYDSKQYDALYQRILLRPTKINKLLTVIIILVAVVGLLCLANAYMSYKTYAMVAELGKVATSTITTTPI